MRCDSLNDVGDLYSLSSSLILFIALVMLECEEIIMWKKFVDNLSDFRSGETLVLSELIHQLHLVLFNHSIKCQSFLWVFVLGILCLFFIILFAVGINIARFSLFKFAEICEEDNYLWALLVTVGIRQGEGLEHFAHWLYGRFLNAA